LATGVSVLFLHEQAVWSKENFLLPSEEGGPRIRGDKAMTTTYGPFDAADYLDSDAVISDYLSAAVEDPDPEVFLAALGDVAKVRGMAQIARMRGLAARASTRL
jgi:hypothetical protein